MLNSPWYMSGFQTLSPWRSRQGMVIVRLQSYNQFRVTITLYEIINEPRIKTKPFVMCFLFFLSLKSTLKKKFLIRLFSSVFTTKEPSQTRAKLTLIHFWFSNALSLLFLARNGHCKIGQLQPIQSDNHPLWND